MKRLLTLVVLATLLFVRALSAQVEDAPVGVAVKIYARGEAYFDEGDTGGLGLYGTFLPSSPGANDAYASDDDSTNSSGDLLKTVLGANGYVRVEPGKPYTVSVSGWNLYGAELNVVAPPGYRVYMNRVLRSRLEFDGSATISFYVESLGTRHPGLAGLVSTTSGAEIEWRMSLGNRLNGAPVGDLALIDTGTRSDWTPLYSQEFLVCEPTDATVYRAGSGLSAVMQIVAKQVVVHVATLSSTAYEVRCYSPAQVATNWSYPSTPGTFNGQPYTTYRIEQGATSTSLKFTKEMRNVTASDLSPAVARREIMTITRSGSWPTLTWEKTGWTQDGETPVTRTEVVSTGTTSARTETIDVRTPGASQAALSVTRTFATDAYAGELVTGETVGGSTGLATSLTYHNDPAQLGSFGNVKTASLPGGGWAAYQYHETNLDNGFRGGQVRYRHRPFLDSTLPGTWPPSLSVGEVTQYNYQLDAFGARTKLNGIETTVNGETTALWQSDDVAIYTGAVNGQPIRARTEQESVSSRYINYMPEIRRTMIRYYSEAAPGIFVRGRTLSVTKTDRVRDSYAYQLGTWDGTTFTAGSGGDGLGTGGASRIAVITGRENNPGTGTLASAEGACTIDPVYLIDGKSTKEVAIRDSRALVVRTESHLWKNSAWQLVQATDYVYDYAGQLTSRTASNGATYTAVYDGGLKTSETDESGLTTSFTYDAGGRVSVATRAGAGAIGALATRYTYDGMGRVTEEQVGWGQTEKLITARTFDTAGRAITETPPAGYGAITHAYDALNRQHTVTRADGGTVITTTHKDGRVQSKTGTATVAEHHTYGVETSGWFEGHVWHQVNVGSGTSARWQKSWRDWVGREVRQELPGFGAQANFVTESLYDNTMYYSGIGVYHYAGPGYLIKTTQTGVTPTRYEYDELGRRLRSALTTSLAVPIDRYGGRINDAETYLESFSGAWWMRTDTKTYPTPSSSTAVITAIKRQRLTGHPSGRLDEVQTTDVHGNVTIQTTDVNRATATTTVTTTTTGISQPKVEVSVAGLPVSVTDPAGLVTTTAYDALRRPSTRTDSRNNTTTTAYVSGTTLVASVTDATSTVVVTNHYDAIGRKDWQQDAAGKRTYFAYNRRDQLLRQWGPATQPVAYAYSAYGEKIAMRTFRAGTGDFTTATWPLADDGADPLNPDPASWTVGDKTTWTYDAASGLLASKTDASSQSVLYTYNAARQLATREWARLVTSGANTGQRVKATYTYDEVTGEQTNIAYNDGTPGVTFTYTRLGQVDSVADFTGTRDLVYGTGALAGQLAAEAFDSFYGQRVLTPLYETSGVVGRAKGFKLGATVGSSSDLEQNYGYDTAGRLNSVGAAFAGGAVRTTTYAYTGNSNLLASISTPVGASSDTFAMHRLYETNRDLLTTTSAAINTTTVKAAYTYAYDDLGRRTSVIETGEIFSGYASSSPGLVEKYTYNDRSELATANTYVGITTSATTVLPGREYGYAYDPIGNRTTTTTNGRTATYTANSNNQYTQRTTPGYYDVSGSDDPSATVTVNTLSTQRQHQYFYRAAPFTNSSAAVYGDVTIASSVNGTTTGKAFLPLDPEPMTYDADGNLTSDGRWDYTWDAVNRLTKMETRTAAVNVGVPKQKLEFAYDYLDRRVQKKVHAWVSGNWSLTSDTRFIYDGWNVIADYNALTSTVTRRYAWGLDFSGTTQGAGGVGGLLMVHESATTYLAAHDGRGNVTTLVNAADGSVAAAYEYSPFGEILRQSGSYAASNPIRFSSKFTDAESGLVYHDKRYYSPSQGRFLGRDSINEKGGLNLYGYCGNNAIDRFDILGNRWRAQGVKVVGTREGFGGIIEEIFDFDEVWEEDPPVTLLNPELATVHLGARGGGAAPTSPLLDRLDLKSPDKATKMMIASLGDDEKARQNEAKVAALIDQLRDLRTSDGRLTQAALLLRKLEGSGLASTVEIVGRFREASSSSGDTAAVDAQGRFIPAAQVGIEPHLSRIVFDADSPDALGTLAHELGHAVQVATGAGNIGSDLNEMEPTRIGNEVYHTIGSNRVYDFVGSDFSLPNWNRYIPHVPAAPNGKGPPSG